MVGVLLSKRGQPRPACAQRPGPRDRRRHFGGIFLYYYYVCVCACRGVCLYVGNIC